MQPKVPKVLIGLPTRSYVQAQTVTTLFSLSGTPGIKIALSVGLGSVIADKRNNIAKLALERGDDYVFFVDSDAQFPPDTLSKLLALDKDIVGAMYFRTYHPYEPNLTEKVKVKGQTLLLVPKQWDREKAFKCWSVGTGTMLIKTKVFKALQEKLESEWFRFARIEGIPAGEDVWFCNEAGKAGFEVWCDPTIDTKHWDNYGFGRNEYNAAHGIE